MELVSGPQLDNYPLVAGYSRQTLFDPEIELLWFAMGLGRFQVLTFANLL